MPPRTAAPAVSARSWPRAGARARRVVAGAALLLAGALLLVAAPDAAPARAQVPDGRAIDIVEAEGVVDGTVASYLVEVIERAGREGAEAVVLQLDVRGAIGDAAATVAAAVASSDVPVVTWVGPPGARAVGGGLLIAQAGDVRAAAPGTLLGPGLPVDLTAADPGAGRDAYRRLAGTGSPDALAPLLEGRAVAVAPAGGEPALPDGVALPPGVTRADVTVLAADAATDAGLLDAVQPTLPDLLLALDGSPVPGGGPGIAVEGATPRFHSLGFVGQLLHAVASPALAYLLVVGGALALAFELFQPGFGVAGVSGVVMAALGVYGLAVLEARWLALVLLLAGVLVLAADLALGRFGLLTAGGTAAVAAGSWLLLPGPAPLDLPGWVAVAVTAGVVVFFVAVMTTVLRAQGNQALAGAERVVGRTGVVRSMLNPEGHVYVGGALWRARAPDDAGRVRAGTPVRVLSLGDRLTLEVVPVDDGERPPREPAAEDSAAH